MGMRFHAMLSLIKLEPPQKPVRTSVQPTCPSVDLASESLDTLHKRRLRIC
jgi:hypothetical protein